MERELPLRGHLVEREVMVMVRYKGVDLATQRLDMVVDRRVVLEVKSNSLLPIAAERQLYNYLRGSALEVGLLLHFGPKPRFYRIVHQPAKQYPAYLPDP